MSRLLLISILQRLPRPRRGAFAKGVWHFGFLALYRAKHKEFNRRDFVFHKYYLLTSLWMPALIMLGTNNAWLKDVPFMLGYATGRNRKPVETDPERAGRVATVASGVSAARSIRPVTPVANVAREATG